MKSIDTNNDYKGNVITKFCYYVYYKTFTLQYGVVGHFSNINFLNRN